MSYLCFTAACLLAVSLSCLHVCLHPPVSACPADFTNLVSQMHLQDLAEADAAKEQVQQVQVRQTTARHRSEMYTCRSAVAVGKLVGQQRSSGQVSTQPTRFTKLHLWDLSDLLTGELLAYNKFDAHCMPAGNLIPLQEFYGDFVALDVHHFMVPVPTNEVLINPKAALPLGASE